MNLLFAPIDALISMWLFHALANQLHTPWLAFSYAACLLIQLLAITINPVSYVRVLNLKKS